MVTVDEYARVRRAHFIDGLGIRQLARLYHHSRRKIREILATPEPKRYVRLKPPASILDPFKSIIDGILTGDEQAPPKQRHTAKKLWRRLQQEHGYGGGYDRVRRYVRAQARQQRETFIPLSHDPGQRLEADFGHIYADFPNGRRQVPVLVVTWGYSNCPFALALPTERTEAILHGLVEAFRFFECVAREVWWDNPKTVVPHLLKGRSRQINERYTALASHYNFEPLFCLVRRPQEKPRVEGRVQFLQQEWATPVPQAKDLKELNAHLSACCLRDRERTQAGQTETIGQRFERERAQALPLPARPFDPAIRQPALVDKYQTVRFDRNSYSVPRRLAFQTVTVKGYVHHVDIVAGSQIVAHHPRSYEQGVQVLDPLHYLVTLERKPAALDHASVYRHWQLPALFGDLRKALEQHHGPQAGARQFIRVLQLLAEHPVERVQRAIVGARQGDAYDTAAILRRTAQAAALGDMPMSVEAAFGRPEIAAVAVPLPNLSRFDQLLSRHEVKDVCDQHHALEDQSEATSSAGNECRVREAGSGSGHGQRGLPAIPASPDRVGGGGPCCQCSQSPDQASGVSGAQGFRHLRLLGDADFEQTEDPGLARGDWIDQQANCCFIGSTGTGKTQPR
jgi:transposase